MSPALITGTGKKTESLTAMIKKVHSNIAAGAPGTEIITDQARIARLLEHLARRYTPLTVRVPGHKEMFTSCAVSVERPYVLLDELMPSNGHQLLLRERALRVAGKLDGVDMCFTVALERVDEQDNVVTYHMNLPAELEYRQRRLDFRVHIPMSMLLRVFIDNNDEAAIEASLHDLSHGGAGLILNEANAGLETGQIRECAIELPEDEWLYCSVELRYSRTLTANDKLLLGVRFVNLYPAQKRLNARCISELERELIRKRAEY